jgi:hypothetical protein
MHHKSLNALASHPFTNEEMRYFYRTTIQPLQEGRLSVFSSNLGD